MLFLSALAAELCIASRCQFIPDPNTLNISRKVPVDFSGY